MHSHTHMEEMKHIKRKHRKHTATTQRENTPRKHKDVESSQNQTENTRAHRENTHDNDIYNYMYIYITLRKQKRTRKSAFHNSFERPTRTKPAFHHWFRQKNLDGSKATRKKNPEIIPDPLQLLHPPTP